MGKTKARKELQQQSTEESSSEASDSESQSGVSEPDDEGGEESEKKASEEDDEASAASGDEDNRDDLSASGEESSDDEQSSDIEQSAPAQSGTTEQFSPPLTSTFTITGAATSAGTDTVLSTPAGIRFIIDEAQEPIDAREINPLALLPPRIRSQDLPKFIKIANESIRHANTLLAGNATARPFESTRVETMPTITPQGISIVQGKNTWRYATANDTHFAGATLIPLINPSWSRGPQPPPFSSVNRAPEERGQAFREFMRIFETNTVHRGATSEWQRANYLAGNSGPEIAKLVATENFLAERPEEGVQHFELLKTKLTEHYDRYADKTLLYKRFQAAKQGADETILHYWERLRNLAEMCHIIADDFLLETHFVTNIRSEKLRKWALAGEHKHEKIIAVGTRWEAEEKSSASAKRVEAFSVAKASQQTMYEEVSATSEAPQSQYFAKRAKFDNDRPRASRNDFSRVKDEYEFDPNRRDNKCPKCGRTHRRGQGCPARNKSCSNCNEAGHFMARCPKPKVIQSVDMSRGQESK